MSTPSRYTLKAPCDNCPFRTDVDFHLNPERVRDIADSLEDGDPFMCHKTVNYDGEREPIVNKTRVCAGARATQANEGIVAQLEQLTDRFGFGVQELDPDLPVHDSVEEWAQSKGAGPRTTEKWSTNR